MNYEVPESIRKNRAEEMVAIEKLINHQMDFLTSSLTTEQRLASLSTLSDLDKAKLIQLEHSLRLSNSDEDFDRDIHGLYGADKSFLASFTSEELENFLEFQKALSGENKKTR